LQGTWETATALSQAGQAAERGALKSGELWAAARLFNELGVEPGDEVQLGRKTFTLQRVLTKDPGQGANFFELAPVVMMTQADLAATALLSPASRAQYTLLFSGQAGAIDELRTTLEGRLQASESILTLEEGSPAVSQALQRAGRFLGLAALLSVVLAGAAIALTASSLVRHETRPVAVLKAFGLSRRKILYDYLLNLWLLAVLAGLLGAALGYVLQFILVLWLQPLIALTLPAASLVPVLTALLTTLITVSGFALSYLLGLVSTSPMQIFQGALNWRRPLLAWVAAGVLPAIFLLLWLQAQQWQLALWLFGGILVAVALFAIVVRAVLGGLARLSLRPAFADLAVLRRSRRSSLLVVVFALGLFALLLLASLRTDLLDRWEATLPADAPNYFLINIQPSEVTEVRHYLDEKGVDATLYPMIRGRLVAINEQSVGSGDYAEGRARRLMDREFNLSSFASLPASNKVIAGEWFDAQTQGLSVEVDIAEALGFGLGDTLTFDIAGQRYSAVISSVREVRWDSMQPNFFVIASPESLADQPHTYITSLYIDPQRPKLIPNLVKRFPSVTAIDTGAILTQVRNLIAQATFAVQGIFIFSLITGVIVLLAALQSQKPERRQEIAIMKSLGAAHKTLRRRIWIEFMLLGALAGFLGAVFALIASNVLGYYLFELGFSFNIGLLLLGTGLGAMLVGLAAYLNLRGLLNVPPMALLKI